MGKFFNHLVASLCAEKGYAALFKAGVVLIGAALLAMSQTGTFLYEKDLSAHKAKFTLETALKRQFDDIICSKLTTQQLDCLLAKHEMNTFKSSLRLLDTVVQKCFWFGVLLVGLSCVGFLCVPFVSSKPSPDSEQI